MERQLGWEQVPEPDGGWTPEGARVAIEGLWAAAGCTPAEIARLLASPSAWLRKPGTQEPGGTPLEALEEDPAWVVEATAIRIANGRYF